MLTELTINKSEHFNDQPAISSLIPRVSEGQGLELFYLLEPIFVNVEG